MKKDSAVSDLIRRACGLKNSWGGPIRRWMEPDLRDQMADLVRKWQERADLHLGLFV